MNSKEVLMQELMKITTVKVEYIEINKPHPIDRDIIEMLEIIGVGYERD
jgi:hypothetical protein